MSATYDTNSLLHRGEQNLTGNRNPLMPGGNKKGHTYLTL